MSLTADALAAKCQIYVNSISNRVEPVDWYEFFTEQIRELRRGRTMPQQRTPLTKEFFTNVFQYPLPTDFDSFIKPHSQLFSEPKEGPYLIYGRDKDFFASDKYSLALTNEVDNKYLLARISGQSDLLLDNMEQTISQYSLAGDGSGLLANSYDKADGQQSVQFNIIDATHQTILTGTLPAAADISDHINFGSTAFLWLYQPTSLVSLKLRLISSVGNYYETAIITVDFPGKGLATGTRELGFSLKNLTSVGNPDKTAITSYQIVIDNTGYSGSGFWVDSLNLRLPTKMELPYNSKYLVKDAVTSALKEAVEAGGDIILCDDTFEAVIMYGAVKHAAVWKFNDKDLAADAEIMFRPAMMNFNRRFPSTEAPLQSNYYRNNKF